MSKEYRVGKALEVRDGDANTPPQADIRILTYNVVDSYGTSWKPGVFTRSIEGGEMPAVWAHNPDRPIGVVKDFRDNGEYLEGTLHYLDFEAVPDARMAHAAMKARAYPGISFAFERKADEEDTRNDGATLITDAEMVEVSPVLRASVPGSRPLAVRSDEQIPVSVAADLLVKFGRGDIDLSDALVELKGMRSASKPESVPGNDLETETPVPDPVQEALDRLNNRK